MDEPGLKELIPLLREEIGRARAGDSDALGHLDPLLVELDRALAEPALESASLRERLGASIREFEVQNPRLTAVLNDIMVGLSGLGI